ncbi:hypothetical protein DFH29DRAFT_1007700 [Suillus ampliporus]|nr:hypothetical protein DFH29DRAFT_1007700 [Suillus ampliporus]
MHIDAVQDDPVSIWSTLASIHVQQRPGARFNAWDDFFSIRKQPDESLSTLIARIEDGMSKIQELRPKDSAKPYSIADLDAELVCMTMVRSLGEEYSHFASSLMLLKSLDKEELKAAFLGEEIQRKRRPEAPSGDSALFTSSGECRCGTKHHLPTSRAKDQAKSGNGRGKGNKHAKSANKASEANTPPHNTPTASTSSSTTPATSTNAQSTTQNANITEFAGNASLRSFDPSHPPLSSSTRCRG